MISRTKARLSRALVCLIAAAAFTWSADLLSQLPSFDRVRVLETPRIVDDAELMNQDGQPAKLSDLYGRVALVFFGFTNCQDVCPLAMEMFRQLKVSGELTEDEVAFVMISVDGDRDTPAVMKQFLGTFSSDFIGLTSAPEHVERIAAQFSASFFKGSTDHEGHYNVTHSPQIFVVDSTGRVRAEFYSPSVEAMAGTVKALVAEGN